MSIGTYPTTTTHSEQRITTVSNENVEPQPLQQAAESQCNPSEVSTSVKEIATEAQPEIDTTTSTFLKIPNNGENNSNNDKNNNNNSDSSQSENDHSTAVEKEKKDFLRVLRLLSRRRRLRHRNVLRELALEQQNAISSEKLKVDSNNHHGTPLVAAPWHYNTNNNIEKPSSVKLDRIVE